MTTKKIGALTAAAAVVMVAVWYLALFRPQSAHLKAAHSAYNQAEQTSQSLQSQLVGLRALEAQIPSDQAKLSNLETAIPKTPDLKDVLTQLHNLAVSTNVELTTVNPTVSSSASTSGGATSVGLSMNVAGTYPDLMAFMTGLDKLARTTTVDSLNLTPSQASGLSATVTARIFYAP
jgi:Tfp pilus assembly protein PilO